MQSNFKLFDPLNSKKIYKLLSFLFVLIACFYSLGISGSKLLLLSLGFCWNAVLISEYLEKKVKNEKYRYSFLKLIYVINNLFFSFVDGNHFPLGYPIARSISPLLFSGILFYFTSGILDILFVMFGSALLEILVYLIDLKEQYKHVNKNLNPPEDKIF